MRGISWLAANQLAAQEGLRTMEWVSKNTRCFGRIWSSSGEIDSNTQWRMQGCVVPTLQRNLRAASIRNVGIHTPNYKAVHSRRPWSWYLSTNSGRWQVHSFQQAMQQQYGCWRHNTQSYRKRCRGPQLFVRVSTLTRPERYLTNKYLRNLWPDLNFDTEGPPPLQSAGLN